MSITGHSISQWLPCPVPSWVPNTIGTWGGNSVKFSYILSVLYSIPSCIDNSVVKSCIRYNLLYYCNNIYLFICLFFSLVILYF